MKKGNKQGFTLVEIAIALGIIAFALVALMAMLPVGLTSLHESKRNTIDARVLQELVTTLQSSDWSTPGKNDDAIIQGYNGALYYYDSYGTLLGSKLKAGADTSPKGTDTNRVVYTAELLLHSNSSGQGGTAAVSNVSLPGDQTPNQYLRNFTILITDLPASVSDRFDFATYPNLKHSDDTKIYNTLINQSSGL